jgi:hypothetical protein
VFPTNQFVVIHFRQQMMESEILGILFHLTTPPHCRSTYHTGRSVDHHNSPVQRASQHLGPVPGFRNLRVVTIYKCREKTDGLLKSVPQVRNQSEGSKRAQKRDGRKPERRPRLQPSGYQYQRNPVFSCQGGQASA